MLRLRKYSQRKKKTETSVISNNRVNTTTAMQKLKYHNN